MTARPPRILRGGIFEMSVSVTDPEGSRIGSAVAKVVPPDDASRAWWQEHMDAL